MRGQARWLWNHSSEVHIHVNWDWKGVTLIPKEGLTNAGPSRRRGPDSCHPSCRTGRPPGDTWGRQGVEGAASAQAPEPGSVCLPATRESCDAGAVGTWHRAARRGADMHSGFGRCPLGKLTRTSWAQEAGVHAGEGRTETRPGPGQGQWSREEGRMDKSTSPRCWVPQFPHLCWSSQSAPPRGY